TWLYFAGLRLSFLVRPSLATCSPNTVSSALGAVVSVLLALAVSLKVPLSRSAWVILWIPVQVTEAPGASSATGVVGVHLKPSSVGESETSTLCSVVLPSLVAFSVYSTSWPTWLYFAGLRLSFLVRPSFGGELTTEISPASPHL